MNQRALLSLLVSANCVCAAVSGAIVHYALRDWPTRYANHTLSRSVTFFFVSFVRLALVGSIATGLYARTKQSTLRHLATAPVILLTTGLLLGLLKAALTGDF